MYKILFLLIRNIQVPDYSIEVEDEDVANERKRVLTGQANSDVLHLINLTKVRTVFIFYI